MESLNLFSSICSVLVALAFAFAGSAGAQPMVTVPTERSENSDQPAATPAPTTPVAKRGVLVPDDSAATGSSPAPENVAKKATPAAKPAPDLDLSTSRRMRKTIETTLKDMEDSWQAAIVGHNVAIVDALVAPDFSGISLDGKFIDKAGVLAEVKNDKDTYSSGKNEKLNVRIYGPTLAVVTGTVRSKGTTQTGQPFDRIYRYTDTWLQRDGKWQCVASQDSVVATR